MDNLKEAAAFPWQVLPDNEAGAMLFARKDNTAVILSSESEYLNAMVKICTGSACSLRSDDKVVWLARELFSDQTYEFTYPLGKIAAANSTLDFPGRLPIRQMKLVPGYYWLTVDVRRGGRSLLGGRVGFDDFYLQAAGETMTHTALSFRTGLGLYIIEPFFGGYGSGTPWFPHTYDPFNKDTYFDLLRVYKGNMCKDSEGLEAGVAGTIYAAMAFRAGGEIARAKFTEKLLKNNLNYIMNHMQDPDGGMLIFSNCLHDKFPEYRDIVGEKTHRHFRDTNQVGELVRTLARGILYFHQFPEESDYVRSLSAAARHSTHFMVRMSVEPKDSWEHVMHHHWLGGYEDVLNRRLYQQEGRQCDVYVPRALSGLSWYAYAAHVLGEEVSELWSDTLRDTFQWAMKKMRADGQFDWQCEDIVENGCHTFLGNHYLAEAAQGYYLYAKGVGNDGEAAVAAECARKALHYITDTCSIRGERLHPSRERPWAGTKTGVWSSLDFWWGPYLYWTFSEYLATIGEDATFRDWMSQIHRGYSEERQWDDIFCRPRGNPNHRFADLTHLSMALVGYLGLRQMEEKGYTLEYLRLNRKELG